MSARFITKCPACDRVTSDCIDSALSADRTEFDGKRCKACTRKPRKSKGRWNHNFATTRKTGAIYFGHCAGHCGIL